MEMRPPWDRISLTSWSIYNPLRGTYDVVVLAADSGGAARVAGADANDGDGRAVKANKDIDTLNDDAK